MNLIGLHEFQLLSSSFIDIGPPLSRRIHQKLKLEHFLQQMLVTDCSSSVLTSVRGQRLEELEEELEESL